MRFKNTSDHIEAYIKAILDQSGIVELQRSQLADTLSGCAKSDQLCHQDTFLLKAEDTWLRASVVAEATFA